MNVVLLDGWRRRSESAAIIITVLLSLMMSVLECTANEQYGLEIKISRDRPLDYTDQRLKRLDELIKHSLIHNNRLIILICRRRCFPFQTQIPRWIRGYMEERKIAKPQFNYQFYENRRNFQIFDDTTMINDSQPQIIYVTNRRMYRFNGSLKKKNDFINFLKVHEANAVKTITECVELENVIDKAQICGNDKIVIHLADNTSASIVNMQTLISSLDSSDYAFYEISQAMDVDMAIELYSRLDQLPFEIPLVIILQNNAYYWISLNIDTEPAQILDIMIETNNPNCTHPSSGWFSISGTLSDVERDYRKQLRSSLLKLESNQSYVFVGATGGIAVVALAISIFWGLNGSTFAK